MKPAFLMRIAPVALLIGSGMIGCSPTARSAHPAFASRMPDPAQFGARAAARAQAAIEGRAWSDAISAAEIAVAASPNRADYRALLGQAYLNGGRFASAAQAFGDALAIDPAVSQAAFGHALALVGAGQADEARAAIAALPGNVPASDRGLALALAGDVSGAIAILEPAARVPGAEARTRQNLALAYALAGDWAKASATAAQDVSPADLPARLAGWAQFTQAPVGADQVALLLGTPRVADPGVPAQLALAQPASAPVAMAQVAPAPEPLAPVAPPPVQVAAGPAPVTPVVLSPMAPPVPLIAAPAGVRLASAAFAGTPPLLRAPTVPFKRALASAVRPMPRPALAFAAARTGSFAVQLGAFRDAGRIERAWAQSIRRLARLASFTPSSTTFLAATRSATFTRLSIAGFNSRDAALAVCSALRSAGGACFVRQVAGDNPVHWASRDADHRAA